MTEKTRTDFGRQAFENFLLAKLQMTGAARLASSAQAELTAAQDITKNAPRRFRGNLKSHDVNFE